MANGCSLTFQFGSQAITLSLLRVLRVKELLYLGNVKQSILSFCSMDIYLRARKINFQDPRIASGKKKSFTLDQLAKELQVTQQTVSRWEHGGIVF